MSYRLQIFSQNSLLKEIWVRADDDRSAKAKSVTWAAAWLARTYANESGQAIDAVWRLTRWTDLHPVIGDGGLRVTME